jgi:hypothetical protein
MPAPAGLRLEDDVGAVSAVVGRFFSFFDNRSGRIPHQREFEGLFLPGASIVTHIGNAPSLSSPADFVHPRVQLLNSGRLTDFHEWETDSHTEVVGTLATRRSRYAKEGLLDGVSYSGQGTKHFHLARIDRIWLIVAASWIDDDPTGSTSAA